MRQRRQVLSIVAALVLAVAGCSKYAVDQHIAWTKGNLAVGIPGKCSLVIDREAYAVGWDIELKQPRWEQHVLTAEEAMSSDAARSNAFKADPSAESSSTPSDYAKSGYDRGHLAPAADMHWSQQAMADSFFMSNMSPLTPMLNRLLWASLEAWVRKQAIAEQCVIVVSGPICTNAYPKKIGKSGVVVPDAFFKAVLDATPPCKMMAFIAPNLHEGLSSDICSYTSTVAEAEMLSGLVLFSRACQDDASAKALKHKSKIEDWASQPQPKSR